MSKKYTAISALLNYDETDVKQDGHFFQPEELNALEEALTLGNTATTSLATATERVTALESEVETMTTAATESKETITNLNSQIETLNAQVAELKGKPSGTGTTVATKEDDKPVTTNQKVTLNHPDHPVNVQARRELAAKKAVKEIKKF